MPESSFEDCHLQLGCDLGMGSSRWTWTARDRDQQPVSLPSYGSEIPNALSPSYSIYTHVNRQPSETELLSTSITSLGMRPPLCISMGYSKRAPMLWMGRQELHNVPSRQVEPSPMTLL